MINTITNILSILAAIAMIEGNPSGKQADAGQARGELCIHAAAVADYNRITGLRVTHSDVQNPEVAYDVARVWLERYAMARTIEDLGAIWNAGPKGARRGKGREYGQRLANLVKGK